MSNPSDKQSDGEQRTARCKQCKQRFEIGEKSDYQAVLDHYLDEHPDSDELEEIVDDVTVERDCSSCGGSFEADASLGFESGTDAGVFAPSTCPDCQQDGLDSLMVDRLETAELAEVANV